MGTLPLLLNVVPIVHTKIQLSKLLYTRIRIIKFHSQIHQPLLFGVSLHAIKIQFRKMSTSDQKNQHVQTSLDQKDPPGNPCVTQSARRLDNRTHRVARDTPTKNT